MSTENPYDAPKGNVEQPEEYAEVKILTLNGRLGRARYIAYVMGLGLIGGLASGLFGAIGAAAPGGAGAVVAGVGSIAILIAQIAFMVFWTIRRVHDSNLSGWFTLLFILPLINFVIWLIPGTDGPNRFGLKPPPNGTGVIVMALVFPFIMILGLLAAIAIPAYNDYTVRAKTQEAFVLGQQVKLAVSEYVASYREYPKNLSDIGIPEDLSSKYAKSVVLGDEGIITVVLSKDVATTAGQTIVFTPYFEQGQFLWRCNGGSTPAKYLPRHCR